MKKIDSVRDFMGFLLRKAERLESDAAHGGCEHDGGASHLRELVSVWVACVDGYFPEVFCKYQKEYHLANDPDYAKYLELKKRFG
jgi:hypothetical protein